jgi:hypothetical protein
LLATSGDGSEVPLMRSRNIKPGFFRNEALSDCSPLTRILFAGLWCIADREGRLEDRPKRIRADVLPYDDGSVDAMLDELHRAGFILRYQAAGVALIQVLNFEKHQNPHCKEPASSLPAPDSPGASPVLVSGKPSSSPADSLIPDSLIPDSLIPDSGFPQSDARASVKRRRRAVIEYSDDFETAWGLYPRHAGASKKEAFEAWEEAVRLGGEPTAMINGASAYARYCEAQRLEPNFIKLPKTFFGPGEHWLCSWPDTPRALTRQEQREEYVAILTGKKTAAPASQMPDIGSIFESEARRVG